MTSLSTSRKIQDTLGRNVRDLRISVTDRCNFRCPYCMPAEIFGERYEFLKREEILSFEEVVRLTRIFIGFGVSKIRITGGEPLVRSDVTSLIQDLASVDGVTDLAMTTNGFLLPRYAHELKEAGLDRLTISLDALDEDVFKQMSGRPYGPEKVLEGYRSSARRWVLAVEDQRGGSTWRERTDHHRDRGILPWNGRYCPIYRIHGRRKPK